jgi:urease accessory protein
MAAGTITAIDSEMNPGSDISLLRLMQLTSPALPVGAFAYSQGLEWAVEAGWVTNAHQADRWIGGLLTRSMANFDLPVLTRLYQAWQQQDSEAFDKWNQFLLAGRGSAELQQEERHMGQALLRLLTQLQADCILSAPCPEPSYAALFAVAACNWHIRLPAACAGFLWSWAENQVAAAIKLVPLGQTDGQRMLVTLADRIPSAVRRGLSLENHAVGAMAPGLVMASALHETQHTRLFRS